MTVQHALIPEDFASLLKRTGIFSQPITAFTITEKYFLNEHKIIVCKYKQITV